MVSVKESLIGRAIDLAERGRLPDWAIRAGIRALLRRRLKESWAEAQGNPDAYVQRFAELLKNHHVAEHTDLANVQHYEVPPDFFKQILGPRLKYSSCLWSDGIQELAQAEEEMLSITCKRAEIHDGMQILELGCGWGSLSLWMAEQYPKASITAVTNSSTQQHHITEVAKDKGFEDLRVIKTDVNDLELAGQFDRIVSVEMFEHVRNYHALFARMATWLKPGGKLFIHVFAHRSIPYLFEVQDDADWMSRYFFSGGTMPSHDLLPQFQGELTLEESWRLNGLQYARTLESWLELLDRRRAEIDRIFREFYPKGEAAMWIQRWRIFLLSCAELFAFRNGEEWGVSHYRFKK